MGSFFVNLQVHARGHDSPTLTERLVACLGNVLRADGYLPAEGDEACDRSVLVVTGSNWIGVYDELCDEQRLDVVEHLANEISSELALQVVTVLVHDSDVLDLRLFDSGALIDRFINRPDYFEEISEEERTAAHGNADRWKAVLAPGVESSLLRSAWDKPQLFADHLLHETTKLLGIDGNRAHVGFRYLQEDDLELEDVELLRLGFRHAIRPAFEARAEGPARFAFNSSSAQVAATVGHSMQLVGSVRSLGGPSRGLSVVVFGDALDRELLSVTSVQLVVTVNEQQTVVSSPTESVLQGEQRISLARFPELDIPAGSAVPESVVGIEETWESYRSAPRIHANVFGDGVRPGAGDVHVGFVPDSAPEGQAVASQRVEIGVPARRPLRAAKLAMPGPQRPKHVLYALASLNLTQSEAAPLVAPILERFVEFLEPAYELAVSVFSPEPRTPPSTWTAKVSELLRSPRWQKLQGELQEATCVAGERKVHVAGLFGESPSDGFSFGGPLVRRAVPGDAPLPTFSLWFDLQSVPRERILAIEAWFEEVMTEVMLRHSGVQALVGRATARHVPGLDTTEYEIACGIHGQCTLQRSWLSRFLRAVPVGTLWIGEPLAQSIPDLHALEKAARVESIGRALKLTIDEGAVGDVEHALAPLLPSAEDWRQASLRFYGRE